MFIVSSIFTDALLYPPYLPEEIDGPSGVSFPPLIDPSLYYHSVLLIISFFFRGLFPPLPPSLLQAPF